MSTSVITKDADRQTSAYSSVGFERFNPAYEPLGIRANFKTCADDFIVDEHLPFSLSGEGEHCWLHIRKTGSNTDWVAKQLAKTAGVRARDVGYAGLKDRMGVTSQWFSVHLPGKPDPDWSSLESDEITILETKRHSRKLRRGALKENHFRIRLRGLEPGNLSQQLEQRCQHIALEGVPNYFGEQRFGFGMSNLGSAERMFLDKEKRVPRHEKSLYLSTARSWLFNEILAQRIRQKNWNQRLAGDVFMLDGKTACFQDDVSAELDQRLARGEIHPTAVLWGEGEQLSQGPAAELEMAVVNANPVFRDGLVEFRVESMRRALRVIPGELSWSLENDALTLVFRLPAGCYATMVLRELVECRQADLALVG